jgi:hypothetical protein
MPASGSAGYFEAGINAGYTQRYLHSQRPLCTLGRAAEAFLSDGTAPSRDLLKGLHVYQQRRGAFGLPNLNGDTSKRYQERRLIGCGC